MTRCEHCSHEFHNVMLRQDCPKCGRSLKHPERRPDDGLDLAGFAIGYATGIPISPSSGISGAALLGAAMHSSEHSHSVPDPTPAPDYSPPASDPSPSSSSSSGPSSDYSGGGSSDYSGGGSSSSE